MRNPRNPRSGNVIVEFAVSWLAFLSLLFGLIDFAFPIYAKTTLNFATRAAVRYAVTAQTEPGLGHDASIKQILQKHTFGLLDATDLGLIQINYFDPSGAATSENAPGNLIEVKVQNYQVPRIAPLMWGKNGLAISAASVDLMEAYSGPPPVR